MTAYAQLANLKRYLDIPSANVIDDDLLTMALDNASAIIDLETHRTFAAAADTTRYHDAIKNVEGFGWSQASRLWLNGDLAQLTSVTNGDGEAIPLSAIYSEGQPTWALVLKSIAYSWAYTDMPQEAIAVTGRWAYSITPPAPIQQATLRLAAWLYRQRDNALDLDRTMIVGNTVLTPAQMPVDVMTIIRPYLKRLP